MNDETNETEELSEFEEFLRELELEEQILTASPFIYPELYRKPEEF